MVVAPFLHEIKAKIWICTQFCKIIGLIFFFPGCGDFCHSVGLGAGGDVDVGFHGFVVGVAGPFHDYLGRDAAGDGEADEGAPAGCVPDDGPLSMRVVLELNTRAKGLLVEEYPLAERDLHREDGKWILRTTVQALEGVGRFVIGLAADVKVVEGKKLVEYVRRYDKKYIQKM